MPPIPCAHCGVNFMRTTTDPEAPKLCNNCLFREEQRNPKERDKMKTVEILIKCPQETQIEIEELCINQGINFSRYFLELHYASQSAIATMKELQENYEKPKIDNVNPVKESHLKVEEKQEKKPKAGKK